MFNLCVYYDYHFLNIIEITTKLKIIPWRKKKEKCLFLPKKNQTQAIPPTQEGLHSFCILFWPFNYPKNSFFLFFTSSSFTWSTAIANSIIVSTVSNTTIISIVAISINSSAFATIPFLALTLSLSQGSENAPPWPISQIKPEHPNPSPFLMPYFSGADERALTNGSVAATYDMRMVHCTLIKRNRENPYTQTTCKS